MKTEGGGGGRGDSRGGERKKVKWGGGNAEK